MVAGIVVLARHSPMVTRQLEEAERQKARAAPVQDPETRA
jgi:hypothetical protein